MKRQFDVIVVGSGPSGGITAYQLARLGVSTLLLEKERLPRYKPCGGGVTTKALKLIDFDVSPVVERSIDTAMVSFARRREISVEGRDIGKMVMRSAFDELIARHAMAAGATVIDSCGVSHVTVDAAGCTVRTATGDLRCQVLVGADGVNSVVARSINAPPLVSGVAIEAEIEVAPADVDRQPVVFDFAAVASGYGYVFPKSRHLSVGVFTTSPMMPHLRQTLGRYLSGGGLPRAQQVRSIVGHRIPLGRLRPPVHAGRVLLVGDAAGTADSLWGEGIYYALRSGRLAADAIVEFFNSGGRHELRAYSDAMQRQVGRDLTWARVLAGLFYKLPEAALVGLVSEDGLANKMMGVLRGDTTYRDYVRSVALRMPQLGAAVVRQGRL